MFCVVFSVDTSLQLVVVLRLPITNRRNRQYANFIFNIFVFAQKPEQLQRLAVVKQ